jgi:FMN phosphatase YigB (HAD superfamily)
MIGMMAPDDAQAWSAPVEEEEILDAASALQDADGLSRQQRALLETRNLIARPDKAVITFDVFDTFLFRRCTAPDGVFERAFHHLPIARTRPGLVESFVQNRITAEVRARQKNVEEIQTREATIAEIYRFLPRHALGLEDTTIEELVAAEMRAEVDLCIVNPDMMVLLREARARRQPLRIGFVSDTYWSAAQLTEILTGCVPGLAFDFIYTSADHRTAKMATLFAKVIEGEGYCGDEGIHIGDNAVADILGARAFGISPVFYPQPQKPIAHLISREAVAAQLLRSQRPDFSYRLDQGFHLVRRNTLTKLPGLTDEQRDTAVIFGPVLAGFQHFLKNRLERIAAGGGKIAVMFLSRDGYLMYQLWQESQSIPAHYVEINRRVALVANLSNIKSLQDVFASAKTLNEGAVQAILKVDLPSIRRYFRGAPDGLVDAKVFIKDLPQLLDESDAASVSDIVREQFLEHLRLSIPDFDGCTDLVMVDLGYYGTIQRSFRGILDRSGLAHRLHGIYLATVDEMYANLPAGDSAAGYIDGSVLTPVIKRSLLRNIAIIEQICSAPQGSVRDYEAGVARHEVDIRSPEQIAFCAELQEYARLFARLFDETAEELKIDLAANLQALRDWSSLFLVRFLIFPTTAEQRRFGAFKQDVNLGTYLLYDMANVEHVQKLETAMGLPAVMSAAAPPMWLGGSIAGMSAFGSCVYGLGVFGLLPRSLIHDEAAGSLQVKIIKDGRGVMCSATCLQTASGELRLRLPVLKRDTGGVVAVPLDGFVQRGVIRSIATQRGSTVVDALPSAGVEMIGSSEVKSLHCRLDGMHFTALNEDAHLLIQVPESTQEVTVITMTVLPLPLDMAAETQRLPDNIRAIA